MIYNRFSHCKTIVVLTLLMHVSFEERNWEPRILPCWYPSQQTGVRNSGASALSVFRSCIVMVSTLWFISNSAVPIQLNAVTMCNGTVRERPCLCDPPFFLSCWGGTGLHCKAFLEKKLMHRCNRIFKQQRLTSTPGGASRKRNDVRRKDGNNGVGNRIREPANRMGYQTSVPSRDNGLPNS